MKKAYITITILETIYEEEVEDMYEDTFEDYAHERERDIALEIEHSSGWIANDVEVSII